MGSIANASPKRCGLRQPALRQANYPEQIQSLNVPRLNAEYLEARLLGVGEPPRRMERQRLFHRLRNVDAAGE